MGWGKLRESEEEGKGRKILMVRREEKEEKPKNRRRKTSGNRKTIKGKNKMKDGKRRVEK